MRAVLGIRAVTLPQKDLHTLILMAIDSHIERTDHVVAMVTHTICNSYQPPENTGWMKDRKTSEECLNMYMRVNNHS